MNKKEAFDYALQETLAGEPMYKICRHIDERRGKMDGRYILDEVWDKIDKRQKKVRARCRVGVV